MKSKISSNKCHNINTNNKNDKIPESAPYDSNNNKGNCIDSNEGNSNSNNNNNSSSKEKTSTVVTSIARLVKLHLLSEIVL